VSAAARRHPHHTRRGDRSHRPLTRRCSRPPTAGSPSPAANPCCSTPSPAGSSGTANRCSWVARVDDAFLDDVTLVLLDGKSGLPETYRRARAENWRPSWPRRLLAERGTPMWIRYVLVPDPRGRGGACRSAQSQVPVSDTLSRPAWARARCRSGASTPGTGWPAWSARADGAGARSIRVSSSCRTPKFSTAAPNSTGAARPTR
jgi:hypothetical protein